MADTITHPDARIAKLEELLLRCPVWGRVRLLVWCRIF